MRILLLLFFFLSGGCGLIYEVVWTKLFALTMGGTTYALSTVLAAFMGGLALGSRYGGKWIDRRGNPLLIYGLLEGAIGLYCLLVPWLMDFVPAILSPFYDKYYTSNLFLFGMMRFILCVLILIIPTVMMGASLPVLSKFYAGNKAKFGWEVGRLYAVNALGAGVGAFTAGFLLLPALGKSMSIYFAAMANGIICVVVISIWLITGRKNSVPASEAVSETSEAAVSNRTNDSPQTPVMPKMTGQEVRPNWGKNVLWAALLVYGINGIAGMAYQVTWTRALALSLGSSTYSFTIIVTVFIFGLALGSWIGAMLVDKLKNPAIAMGWVEVLVGYSAALAMWGLGRMPVWIAPIIGKFGSDWNTLLAVEFLLVAAILILPTVLMGAVFPLAMKTVGMCRSGVGEPVGLAYGVNTLGSIIGSIAAGFFLMPAIGLQRTIELSNALNWVAGSLLLMTAISDKGALKWVKSAAPLLLGIMLTALMPRWDKALMSSGPYIYMARFGVQSLAEEEKLLFNKDSADATISVFVKDSGLIFLRINGKTDASAHQDVIYDMATQELISHVPILIHPNPKKVCIIGLASGMTLGSATRYPVEKVDVIEIIDAIIKASDYFKYWNYNSTRDPRVKIILADGRNHLLMTKEKYDVIISEPSNQWVAGESILFTREFFELARDKLAPGGVFSCWMQGYEMSSESFTMVMRTFQSVFPNAMLWDAYATSDYMFVGSTAPMTIDPALMQKKLENQEAFNDLKRVGVPSLANLLSKLLSGQRHFMLAAGEGEIHTDNMLQLEYRGPKYLYQKKDYYGDYYKTIIRFSDDPKDFLSGAPASWPAGFIESLKREVEARNLCYSAELEIRSGYAERALILLGGAIKLAPEINLYKERYKNILNGRSTDLVKKNRVNEAVILCKRAIELMPDDAEIRTELGTAYMMIDKVEEAYEEFKKAAELNPNDFIAIYNMGFIEQKRMERESANEKFLRAIQINPKYPPALNAVGNNYAETQRIAEAEKYFRKAIEADPKYADSYTNLGRVLSQHKDEKVREEGKRYLQKAVDLNSKIEENKNDSSGGNSATVSPAK